MKLIALPLELARAQEKIEGHARNYGLSFFQTVFEEGVVSNEGV